MVKALGLSGDCTRCVVCRPDPHEDTHSMKLPCFLFAILLALLMQMCFCSFAIFWGCICLFLCCIKTVIDFLRWNLFLPDSNRLLHVGLVSSQLMVLFLAWLTDGMLHPSGLVESCRILQMIPFQELCAFGMGWDVATWQLYPLARWPLLSLGQSSVWRYNCRASSQQSEIKRIISNLLKLVVAEKG